MSIPVTNQVGLSDEYSTTVGSGSATSPKPVKHDYKDRPCDYCRKQKQRCVFEQVQGSCMRCRSKGLNCTFFEEPTRRKKRPRLSNDSGGKPSSLSSISVSPRNSIIPGKSTVAVTSTVLTNGVDSAPSIIDQTVGDYSAMPGPSLLKKTLGLQNSRCAMLIGSTDILDDCLLRQVEFNAREEAEKLPRGTRLRRANKEIYFLMQDDKVIDGYENISRYVEAIELQVAPHGAALVDIFFRVIHPSYPVLHKKVVIEKYKRSYREFSPPLLGAIYALALGWWAYIPNLTAEEVQNKPNADSVYQIALESFSHMTKRPKLSTIQAGLLLLQKQKFTENGSWPLLGQVVSLAADLGLHLDCRNWKIPRWEIKLRRRLAWSVWIQDKWNALTLGRPSHLNYRDDWLVTPLTDDDFPDKPPVEGTDIEGSSDIQNGKLIFQYMVYLTDVVDHLLRSLYSGVSLRDLRDTMEILQVARPLQQKLKDWAKSIPDDIRMASVKNRKFSSNGYLYLAYLSAEITLHRRIIHSLDPTTPPDLVKVCRSAAKERLLAALDFARDLRPEHVQAFWHSCASANFALIGSFAMLLLTTAVDDEEIKFIQNALKNYRWMLRVSSVGSEQMNIALQKLDLCFSFLPGVIMNDPVENDYTNGQHDSEISEDDGDIEAEGDIEESIIAVFGDGIMRLPENFFEY